MGLTLAMTLIFEFSRSYVILTIWWPRSGVRIYQIVTGVTSVVGVPSTHLVSSGHNRIACVVTHAVHVINFDMTSTRHMVNGALLYVPSLIPTHTLDKEWPVTYVHVEDKTQLPVLNFTQHMYLRLIIPSLYITSMVSRKKVYNPNFFIRTTSGY